MTLVDIGVVCVWIGVVCVGVGVGVIGVLGLVDGGLVVGVVLVDGPWVVSEVGWRWIVSVVVDGLIVLLWSSHDVVGLCSHHHSLPGLDVAADDQGDYKEDNSETCTDVES